MHCREFRNKHVAFVDDLLPAYEMDAMQRHVSVCSNCARQDTKIRRSLMMVRNLPPIEPSPEFMRRLNERLANVGPVSRVDVTPSRSYLPSMPSMASFAALAAGIAAVAYLAVETNNYFGQPDVLPSGAAGMIAAATNEVSAPVPSIPAPDPAPLTSAALVASVPTGIPIFPAVLMVGAAPMRFASVETRDGDQGR